MILFTHRHPLLHTTPHTYIKWSMRSPVSIYPNIRDTQNSCSTHVIVHTPLHVAHIRHTQHSPTTAIYTQIHKPHYTDWCVYAVHTPIYKPQYTIHTYPHHHLTPIPTLCTRCIQYINHSTPHTHTPSPHYSSTNTVHTPIHKPQYTIHTPHHHITPVPTPYTHHNT